MENNDNKAKLIPKPLKKIILELIKAKRELEFEKVKGLDSLKRIMKPKLETDMLKVEDVLNDYKLSRKTFDRMRCRGLKTSQKSAKSTIWTVRKDMEDFLKKDRYDR